MAVSRRAKAVDIPKAVKDRVWARDKGRCIVCGCPTAMPNAHYISRAKGGLGVEQNIVTLCTEFGNGCHRQYDFGPREIREEIGSRIRDYLMSHYPDWDEGKLIYRKWQND
jgi:5-methylcytosine-specific restriction endonuclease McrA